MQLGILKTTENQTPTSKKPSVVIAANLIRTKILLDFDGNEIKNFKTKEIIKRNEE